MPTHDIYLDNGTDIGLTVDDFILSHFDKFINKVEKTAFYSCFFYLKISFKINEKRPHISMKSLNIARQLSGSYVFYSAG